MGASWRDPACHPTFIGYPEQAVRKQSSCHWVGVLWRPCDVTIIAMLQNAISKIANSHANFGNLLIYIYKITPNDYFNGERVWEFSLL